LVRLALWTIALEGVCLLAFVTVVSSGWAAPGKQFAVAAAFLVAVVTAWLASSRASLRGGIRYVGLVAVGNLAVFEVLAYTRYPGLAKDLDFASGQHLLRVSALLLLSFGIHFLFLLTARLIRRLGALKPET
jgi:hypothetical protein